MPRRFQFSLWVLFYLMACAALGAVAYRTVEQEYRASLSVFDDPEYRP